MNNIVTEKKEWTEFMGRMGRPTTFLHRDEFEGQFKDLKVALPAVLQTRAGRPEVLVSAEEINRCKTTPELIALIEQKVSHP
jgi:hypothetical protein